MALYVIQSLSDFKFKAGWAEIDRVADRVKEHETSGGPQRLIMTHPTDDRRDEGRLFADLAECRMRSPTRRRPYELFLCTPRALAFFSGRTVRALGFTVASAPIDPYKEDANAWLSRVSLLTSGLALEAALHNMDQERRIGPLREAHGGGWTLADALAGKRQWGTGRVHVPNRKQQTFDFAVSVVESSGRLISEVRCKGRTFRYFVFAEAQRREGIAAHPSAIRVGIPWLKPRVVTGRAPRQVSPVVRTRCEFTPDLFAGVKR